MSKTDKNIQINDAEAKKANRIPDDLLDNAAGGTGMPSILDINKGDDPFTNYGQKSSGGNLGTVKKRVP